MNRLLAIYPTARKVEDVLKRDSAGMGCLLAHRITTFPQLTDALLREITALPTVLGHAGERLALEQAIVRTGTSGDRFPSGGGLRDRLLALIRQLKSAAITGEDLRVSALALADSARARVLAFAQIFVEYDQLLKEAGAVCPHDRERLVVELLHRMEVAGQRPRYLVGIERMLIAEVYDPSLVQFMMIAALIRIIGDAEITIQAEPHKLSVDRFADLTWNRFVAEESIADKVLPHFVRRGGREGRLGFVLTHLFSEAPDRPDPPAEDSSVRIIEAPNASREAEEIARSIRRMLERPGNEHIPLDRIAIVARDLASYSDYLEGAFRRYRIPLSVASRKPLSAFPPARLLRHILRIPSEDYSRETLLSLCNAPFVRLDAAAYREIPAEVGYIDRGTRPLADCVAQRRAELSAALEGAPNTAEAQRLDRKLDQFNRGAESWCQLLATLESLEHDATISDHVANLFGVLERLDFDPAGDSLADESAASAGPLRSALDELARESSIVAPQRVASFDEFARLAQQMIDETTLDMRETSPAGVRAMPVLEARGLDFDLVFIVGLNDGVFPAYHPEDPLLPDEVIRQLNRPLRDALRLRMGKYTPDAPGPILRTRYDRNAEEPFLFFLALSMPERSVVLSYAAAADSNGNPLAVSPFVSEVSRVLNGPPIERPAAEEFIPNIDACFSSDEFLNRAAVSALLDRPLLHGLAEAGGVESVLQRTAIERDREAYFLLPTRQELAEIRRGAHGRDEPAGWFGIDLSPDPGKSSSAGSFDGRVTVAMERHLLEARDGAPRQWSAAQLTELAACGFKFFARRILQLREAGDLDYEQSALEIGDQVHQILHRVFEHSERFDAARLRIVKEEVLGDFHRRGQLAARDPAFFDLGWESIRAMVDEVVEYEIAQRADGAVPAETYHEYTLRFAVPLANDATAVASEIVLVGQIDRIEIYREGARIGRVKLLDYKASRNLQKYAQLLEPDRFACEDMQMPVYALGAVEQLHTELSPRTSVETSYIALKSRAKENPPRAIPIELLVDSREPGAKHDAECVRTVADRIRELVNGAIAGRFDVDPLECSDYCPYRRVCRYRKPFSRQ
ncbi:MAG TPA: PD-(D/E)XK nuclease family protein [Candidatus Binataceae bacterium]|nr:PD-(D/E)XK nuclease family protein [Candidatus Binataceae bacterium]